MVPGVRVIELANMKSDISSLNLLLNLIIPGAIN
jgi:hypothetical protein